MLEIIAKAVAGGVLVVVFAVVSAMASPKRFAGIFAAAPSVALASLAVTLVSKGVDDARLSAVGMIAGAVGFTAYCLCVPAALRRLGTKKGAAVALLPWLAVALIVYPVLP